MFDGPEPVLLVAPLRTPLGLPQRVGERGLICVAGGAERSPHNPLARLVQTRQRCPHATGVDEHDSEHTVVMWRGETAVAVSIAEKAMHVSFDGTAGMRALLASDGEVRLTDDGVMLPANSVAVVGR